MWGAAAAAMSARSGPSSGQENNQGINKGKIAGQVDKDGGYTIAIIPALVPGQRMWVT